MAWARDEEMSMRKVIRMEAEGIMKRSGQRDETNGKRCKENTIEKTRLKPNNATIINGKAIPFWVRWN